jgi:Helicase conserved C-terminal domain
VLLDESHAARRAKAEEREFNSPNLLLGLLRELCASGTARSILLLSATPMQTQPWEPWDLLDILGEGDPWLAEFADVRRFYDAAGHVAAGGATDEEAQAAAELIRLDPAFPSIHGAVAGLASSPGIADLLAFPKPSNRGPLASWMRRGSPLSRRMHRNTRATLRAYFDRGMLASPPPTRTIDDVRFDLEDPAERAAYEAVDDYIDRRYELLEKEQPGKGFVMTIYRRRASSSPRALERSLGRRREQLIRVAQRKAINVFFEGEEGFDSADLDEIDEELGRIPAGLPQTREAAREEIAEIDSLLTRVQSLPFDSKFDRFVGELKRITADGRAALVFTGYTDTMMYLRDLLEPVYADRLACYSGDGGNVWRGDRWVGVSKTAITDSLEAGRVGVLLCTDAASEGLNLQAAGALVNYDLPWNPARVEQRVGRIDRIGQRLPFVRVANLFLRDSVDDDVYRVLRVRCGLFEHFVGPMQPVLARARRMLLRQDALDVAALEAAATLAAGDTLASETYAMSEAAEVIDTRPGVTRPGLDLLLRATAGRIVAGLRVTVADGVATIEGLRAAPVRLTVNSEALADDPTLLPLSLADDLARQVADRLDIDPLASPLVIGTAAEGGHRSAVAIWIGTDVQQTVSDLATLEGLVRTWDGSPADPERRYRALESARQLASDVVRDAMAHELNVRREAAHRRRGSAARRLRSELGRYLVAMGSDTDELNETLYRVMSGHGDDGRRARQAFELLGGYPEWPSAMRRSLDAFDAALTPARRASRLSGMEVDAALADPRWRQRDPE